MLKMGCQWKNKAPRKTTHTQKITKNTRMSVEKYPKPCTLQWIEKIELILGNPGGWAEGVGEDRGESGPVTTAGLLPDPARRTQENEE